MKVIRKTKLCILLAALVIVSTICFQVNTKPMAETVDGNNDDWLHCRGNKIYDMYGNEVWLTGANWFGFNCSENCFHGAWYDVKDILSDVADRGIGLLRIPISTELIYSWMIGKPNPVSSVTASNNPPYHCVNPDFYDPETDDVKNSMEIFDIIMGYCKEFGIKVMIDIHSPDANNSGHDYELWYGKDTKTCGVVTTKMWIDTLVWITDKYKNDDTLLALDLKNEPHGKRGYSVEVPTLLAKWDNSTDENNWKYAAETCAKAILDVNPNMLIVIEGIEQYPKTEKGYTFETPDIWGATGDAAPWHGAWWGGNLRGVKDYPIDLGPLNSQVVYSPHDYGPSVYAQTWFDKDFTTQTLLDDYWYDTWAYINDQGIAPLLIGEWGGHMDGGKNQRWMTLFRDYMIENRIHHTFWCINPNSGDTGGLVGNDWSTWDEDKYGLLKPALWQSGGKFIGLDHQIPLGKNGISLGEYYGMSTPLPTTPRPTNTPTQQPTQQPSPTAGPVIYGDINNDNLVNSLDLTLLKRMLLGFNPPDVNLDAADLNMDGAINSMDLSILKRYLTKKIDTLPYV
ncbi:MAG: cellulase family glycosylhydrolase [Clostridium sp.]|nr:cellulase family glycosylhydrolase [Clostridium sp.]